MPQKPVALLAVLASALAAASADAQSLRGSRASVEAMYAQARAHDLTFHRTAASVRVAAGKGELVRLRDGADYRLHDVSYPYALPSTKLFLDRLASQYRRACGERLVVTSALRPTSLRLANGADKTVHPAGMALDLRRPANPRCLAWLRDTLLALEGRGVIEATEERRPPHFHVAVFPRPYRRYVDNMRAPSGPAPARAARGTGAPPASTTYRVRSGDSLWSIARRHGTTVDRLREANDIRSSRILAGQVLVIPGR